MATVGVKGLIINVPQSFLDNSGTVLEPVKTGQAQRLGETNDWQDLLTSSWLDVGMCGEHQ